MSTQRQRRRGTAAEHAAFTGAIGEITYDTINNRAVGHDGAKAGGYPHQTVAGHRRQDGVWMDVAGSGSPVNYNVLIGIVSPVPAALVTGMALEFLPPGANTGAVTIDVGDDDGAGAKAIQSGGAALSAGQLDPSTPVRIVYDGTAWQLAAASGGLVPLETQTVGSAVASVDFTDLPIDDYEAFEVRVSNLQPATDNVNVLVRVRTEGGSFESGAADYAYATLRGTAGSGTASVLNSSGSTSIAITANLGNAADERASGVLRFYGFGGSGAHKHVEGGFSGLNNSGGLETSKPAGSYIGGTGRLDGIRFFMASGDIAAGTFELFGIRGA